MQPAYDLAWILPHVRKSLRGVGNMNFDAYIDGLFRVLEELGVTSIQRFQQSYTGHTFNFDAAHADIKIAATEAFYYLEQNRFILRPAPTQFGAFVAHGQFLVTKRGAEWANGVDPLPEDYNGYMKQFVDADEVVRLYVSEALNTYVRGTFFASAVMLGAAAEATVYNLSDALIAALQDAAKREALRRRIDERKLERLFSFIESTISAGHKSGAIPYDVTEGTTRHLISLFEYIKAQRNDAVHPKNFQVSPECVRLSIYAFPLAFRKVESLRKWCMQNPGTV